MNLNHSASHTILLWFYSALRETQHSNKKIFFFGTSLIKKFHRGGRGHKLSLTGGRPQVEWKHFLLFVGEVI